MIGTGLWRVRGSADRCTLESGHWHMPAGATAPDAPLQQCRGSEQNAAPLRVAVQPSSAAEGAQPPDTPDGDEKVAGITTSLVHEKGYQVSGI